MSSLRNAQEPVVGTPHVPAGRLRRPSPLGPALLDDRQAGLLRTVARIWTLVALAGFGASFYWRGVPFNEAGGSWQGPLQVALLGVVGVGWLLAWKWEWLGASFILLGAAGLGVLAAIQFQPVASFVPFAILLVPAVLHWLCWQRWQPAYVLVALAASLAAVIIVGGVAANSLHDDYFGPTHSASDTVIADAELVNWVWSGAVTMDSAAFRAQLLGEPETTRLAVSPNSDLSNALYVDGAPMMDGAQPVFAYDIDGLQAATEYHYAVEVDGALDGARRGRFQTLPEGPATFSFVFGACAATGSNGAVFDAARAAAPLFLLHAGDFHYGDIEENDPAAFVDEMTETLTAPAQSALYRSVPIAYVWDDHDYGPNSGDRMSPSRAASRTAYDVAVPHFPLASAAPDGPIYQAFTVGRARFILTDLRSHRDPASLPDGPDKSILGAEQKAWFKQQLLEAQDTYPLIFWINTVPWIGAVDAGADDWSGYTYERAELAGFIADNDIDGLIMLAGDAHMVALDDGTNSNYSTTPGPSFPVFHAAAFDRRGSTKGGPFSHGAFPGGGHYGEITVTDDGRDRITVTMTGKTWEGETLVTHTVTFEAPFAIDPWPEFFGQVASGNFTPD